MHPYEYIKYTIYCLVFTSVFINFPQPHKLPLSKGLFKITHDYFPSKTQWIELSHGSSNCHIRMEYSQVAFLSKGSQFILESTQWLSQREEHSLIDKYLNCASGQIFISKKDVIIHEVRSNNDLISNLRVKISQQIKHHLDNIHAAYAHALFLGVSHQLPKADKGYFKNFGLLYLLAISGFHVQYLYGNFTRFLYLIPGSPLLKKFLIFMIFTLFIPIAGGGPAVFRAVLAQGFQLFIQLSEIPIRKSSQLLWLAAILLIMEPRWILHLGFQLSFMATWGIQQFTFIQSPWNSLSISLRAILSTWGLMGIHFGSLSLLSVFVQIPTTIFITLAMTLSVIIIPLKAISSYYESTQIYRDYFAHLESLFMVLYGLQIKLFVVLQTWNKHFIWNNFLRGVTHGFYWILWGLHFVYVLNLSLIHI